MRLHQYQKDAIRFLLNHPRCSLFADPGAGKTVIILSVLAILKARGLLPRPVLVTAPSIVCETVWRQEAEKWRHLIDLTFSLVAGSKKEKKGALQSPADIHLVTHEYLRLMEEELPKYRTLIVDESSRYFTKWTGDTVKILRRLSFERQHIMTGTPTPNTLMSLFSQQFIADKGASFGKTITPFRAEFFNESRFNVFSKWVPKKDAEEKMSEHLRGHCYRIEIKEHLDIPELSTHDVLIPGVKRNLSKCITKKGILDPIVCADERRVTGGVSVEGLFIDKMKLKELEGLLSELQGKQAIVFYSFDAEGIALARHFNAPKIDGGTPKHVRKELVDSWNNKGLDLLLINPATAGYGINLQSGGHDLIFYTLPNNQAHYSQAIARVWRQGVEQKVRVHRLLIKGSIDIAAARSLESKEEQQTALLNAIKEMLG